MRVLLLLMFFMLAHFCANAQLVRPKWLDDLGGASGYAQVTYITVDKQNNIYVTGGFAGTVDFDPSAAVKNLTSVGGEDFFDVFVGKYKQDGTLIWIESMGGSGTDVSNGLAVDKDGNVSIVGYYQSSTFNADPGPGVYNLIGNGNNAFLIHLDTNGGFLWANSLGSGTTGTTNSFRVATDSQDNVITTSQFSTAVTIGDSTYKMSGFTYDGLVVKYGATGNLIWSLHLHGTPGGNTEPYGVRVDSQNNIIISGLIDSTINLNPLGPSYDLTAANHTYAAFVAKYSSSGTLIWANGIENSIFDESAICIDRKNNVYFNTIFGGSSLSPSAVTFGSTVLNSTYPYNACIAKYSSSGVLQYAKSFGGQSTTFDNRGLNEMALDSGGNIYLTGFLSGGAETVNFDPNKGNSGNLIVNGSGFYVAKYDSSANYNYAFFVGNNCSNTRSFSIVIDTNNYVDVAGQFCSTDNFDQSGCSSDNVTAISPNYAYDAFIAQYAPVTIENNIITSPAINNFCSNGSPSAITGSLPTGGDGTYTYQWQSSADSVNFVNISGAASQNYTPPTITATTYYQRIVNSGGCPSPPPALSSNIVKLTILPTLTAPVVTLAGTTSSTVIFTWTAVAGATGYQVSTDGGLIYSAHSGLTDTISNLQPGQSVTLIVQATGSITCQTSATSAPVTGMVPAGDLVYVANAFTPNADGRNDILHVLGANIQTLKFYIYDQWGELLFSSTSQQNGWDGTYKGTKEPVGVYVYYLEAVMADGQNVKKKGTITLLK